MPTIFVQWIIYAENTRKRLMENGWEKRPIAEMLEIIRFGAKRVPKLTIKDSAPTMAQLIQHAIPDKKRKTYNQYVWARAK